MTPWLRRNGHRIFHPLAGAGIGTLAAVLRDGGGVAPRHLHRVATALAAAAMRAPLDALERRAVERRGAEAAAMEPPVFILGHWRSGTTHLYNVLARDPRFGIAPPLAVGLPLGFLGLNDFWRARLEEWLPPDRIIDPIPVAPDSPQEDELALALMQPLSYYHGIFFPRRLRQAFLRGVLFEGCTEAEVAEWRRCLAHFLFKLHLAQPGRRMLVKNPAHTARVAQLRALWPGAGFVHIHRDPFEVYASTRRMLRTLLRELALQDFDAEEVDALVLDLYPAMMERFAAEAPAGTVELRYERFVADPMGELERLYDGLGLGGFAGVAPRFEAYLRVVSGYKRREHAMTAEVVGPVRERWRFAFERWEYSSKAVASPRGPV